MAVQNQVQYVSDGEGQPVGVIIPIEMWRKIEFERQNGSPSKGETMKTQLLEGMGVVKGLQLDESRPTPGGPQMAEALEQLAGSRAVARVDAVSWEREQRIDRPLPDRGELKCPYNSITGASLSSGTA